MKPLKRINRNHPLLRMALSCYLLLVTFYLAGCGYTLQTRADLPFDTISMGKIENKSLEPKLQDSFNRVLAETFAEYGFRVGPSRYVLEGEITQFVLNPRAEKSLVAQEYEVVVNANFKLIDKVRNKGITLVAGSPFITSFGSSGKLEYVIASKEVSTIAALRNISQELVRQIIYNISSNFAYLLFSVSDIKDARSLALKFQDPEDLLSQYIREEFSYEAVRLIDDYDRFEYPSDQLRNALVSELNLLLQKSSFYDPKRFEHITLSEDTEELVKKDLKGIDRTRLNRLLLEEAYPDEIASFTLAYLLFTARDIKNSGSLALKFKEQKDPLSQYMFEKFSPEMRRLIDSFDKSEKPSGQLAGAFVREFNEMLHGESLFDNQRFAHVKLSEEALDLAAKNPKGAARARLNRLLLEEAYPAEIAKHKKKTEEEMAAEKDKDKK